jgi:O-antigen ligase
MDIRQKIKNIFGPKEETFKWYFALIYLLIIAIPFNHKEAFSVYDPDLVWSKYVLVALAAVGLVTFIRYFKTYVNDVFFWLLLAFVGFQTLSLLQTYDLMSSLRLIAFQLAVAFTYIPIRNFIYERKNGLKDLIVLYGFVFIVVAVFLGVQIYLESQYKIAVGGVWPVPGFPTRYGSTFWDINHFGAFCSALILIFMGFLFQKNSAKLPMKIFIGSVAAVALVALHLTSSRSALIGFIAGLFVFGILYFRNFKFKVSSKSQFAIFYVATLAAVSGFLYFLYFQADSLKASLLYRSVSFFSHLFLLKVGIIVGIQNFLLGIGANSFHAYFRSTEWANVYYYIDKAALDLKLPLHNLWLETLAETGLVSFIVFTAFWIILLVGLYRVYISKNDFIALGFLGAVTSFLVAGLMYSYKSEFFWLFVLIAAAYVSKYYIDKSKTITSSVNNILCPGGCDIKRIVLISLSAITLIVPIMFLTHPLNSTEIGLFNGAYQSNFIVDMYSQSLLMFRYIIGNYTYTGRIISAIFYAGSVSLSFLILKRYFGGLYALALTALIFGIANIFEPNLLVSIKFYMVFVMLAVVGFFVFIMSLIHKENYIFDLSKKISNLIMISLVLVVVILGIVSNNLYFKKSYDTNLTFLLELAYNRQLMDKALIQVSQDIDLLPVYYFADNVQKKDNTFISVESDVMPAQVLAVDYYDKNLFIFTGAERENIERILKDVRKNPKVDVVELKQGNYYLIYIEKKSVPLVYSQ